MLDTGRAERLSQSDLARHLGVSRQAVHELLKRGILAADADGLIDVAQATEAIARSLRADSKAVASVMSAAGKMPTAEGAGLQDAASYQQSRALREAAEAAMAQLKLALMSGELVEADRVRRAVVQLAATVRSGFERIPDKLADRLAVESTAAGCHAILLGEIDMVLADLAKGAASIELEAATDGRV